uniref:Uncharacterized protein n=1 Tax=Arundo donax TaxID=35708 RepID=A0A0A8XMX7_ARUDO
MLSPHLPLHASKSSLALFRPANASPRPNLTPLPPNGGAGRRLRPCARRRGLPVGGEGGDGDGTGQVPRGVRACAARRVRLPGAPLRRGNILLL